MINEGFIKLHRCLKEWEWYRDSHMVHLFIHLILEANHKPLWWRGIFIDRGQLVTGRLALSEATGISERTCRTCLNRLKSTSSLTIKTTNKFSLITINNYSIYQDLFCVGDQQNDQQDANKRPATDQQPTTNKNDKNVKKEERESEERECALETESHTLFENSNLNGNGTSKKQTKVRQKEPKVSSKPDFSEGACFANPGFSSVFCAGKWQQWCFEKEAPYRTQKVAEEALSYLYELSGGDEQLAVTALRDAYTSSWRCFKWYFKHLEKEQKQKHDHANYQNNNGKSFAGGNHGAENLFWLESHH